MKRINKRDVDNVELLFAYLGQSANEYKELHHYTSFESLMCILNYRSFRLSELKRMNDKIEQRFSDNNYFILSMTSACEYISMWAMYGKKEDVKIRISFDSKELKKCLKADNFYKDRELKEHYFSSQSNISSNITYSDVVYIDSQYYQYKHKENGFDKVFPTYDTVRYLGGLIKYDAWEFERETRIRVLNINDDDFVYLALSEEFLSSIKVTFNPWMKSNIKNMIKKEMALFGIDCKESEYDDQIEDL